MNKTAPDKINILGVNVSAIDMPLALDTIDAWIAARARQCVCVRDVHGVMACQTDAELRRIHHEAGLVTPDGMPLVWVSRLRGYGHVRRVSGSDLMFELCRRSVAKGYRHFLYGGAPGVAERLASNLRQRFAGLTIVGSYSPPFRPLTPEEDDEVVRMINASKANVVWVGLSTPKQERWMAAHVGRLDAPVLLGVGAAFDFHAGVKKRAPAWMQRSGLEWFFRLVTEPLRLWRRYLVMAPKFVFLVAVETLALRLRSGGAHEAHGGRSRGQPS